MLDMAEAQSKGDARQLQESEMNRAKQVGAAVSRRRRQHDFTLFRKNAAAFFEAPPSDEAHERMRARYGYSVAVAGDDPSVGLESNEARVVEVAYGDYEIKQMGGLTDARLRGEWVGAKEEGAALMYSQGVDGAVTAFLYPSRIEQMKPEEDGIVLARYADIELLTGKGVLERHWGVLRAYAEVTSLEGEPSISDHLRVAWLRFTRPVIRDGRRQRTEALDYGIKLAGVGAAVALGALILNILA